MESPNYRLHACIIRGCFPHPVRSDAYVVLFNVPANGVLMSYSRTKPWLLISVNGVAATGFIILAPVNQLENRQSSVHVVTSIDVLFFTIVILSKDGRTNDEGVLFFREPRRTADMGIRTRLACTLGWGWGIA